MFRTLRLFTVAATAIVLLLLGFGHVQPDAQTTHTSTTLTTAINADVQTLVVGSATGIDERDFLIIDQETFHVRSVSGTTITVQRGFESGISPHLASSIVYVGARNVFTRNLPAGGCTSTAEQFQPRVIHPGGRIFDCTNGRWVERVVTPMTFAAATIFTGRVGARDSFDQGYTILQDDGTAKSVTDNEENFVTGSPLGAIEYREEVTKTLSSWVVGAGRLALGGDDDADNEGVEVSFGAPPLDSYFIAGTNGACISASITLTDISGTDQLLIGFRDNAAYIDVAAYASYTIWNAVGVNAVDGSIVSLQEVSEATDSDDSGVNMADGETRAFKVCVTAAGVPSAYYTAAVTLGSQAELYPTWIPITMTETGSTLTAAQAMIPFLSFLSAGTDGATPFVNWVQLEPYVR